MDDIVENREHTTGIDVPPVLELTIANTGILRPTLALARRPTLLCRRSGIGITGAWINTWRISIEADCRLRPERPSIKASRSPFGATRSAGIRNRLAPST